MADLTDTKLPPDSANEGDVQQESALAQQREPDLFDEFGVVPPNDDATNGAKNNSSWADEVIKTLGIELSALDRELMKLRFEEFQTQCKVEQFPWPFHCELLKKTIQ